MAESNWTATYQIRISQQTEGFLLKLTAHEYVPNT